MRLFLIQWIQNTNHSTTSVLTPALAEIKTSYRPQSFSDYLFVSGLSPYKLLHARALMRLLKNKEKNQTKSCEIKCYLYCTAFDIFSRV